MTWTCKSFLEWSAGRLAEAGIESPRLESEVLLAGGLHANREDFTATRTVNSKKKKSLCPEVMLNDGPNVNRWPISSVAGNSGAWIFR